MSWKTINDTKADVIKAVSDGYTTRPEMREHLSYHERTIRKNLKALVEDGRLYREELSLEGGGMKYDYRVSNTARVTRNDRKWLVEVVPIPVLVAIALEVGGRIGFHAESLAFAAMVVAVPLLFYRLMVLLWSDAGWMVQVQVDDDDGDGSERSDPNIQETLQEKYAS